MAPENDQIRMTNVERMTKQECPKSSGSFAGLAFVIGISEFFRHSDFVIRHSYRSASIGSVRAARWAGKRQARSATTSNSNGTIMNVIGSIGLTPSSRL